MDPYKTLGVRTHGIFTKKLSPAVVEDSLWVIHTAATVKSEDAKVAFVMLLSPHTSQFHCPGMWAAEGLLCFLLLRA